MTGDCWPASVGGQTGCNVSSGLLQAIKKKREHCVADLLFMHKKVKGHGQDTIQSNSFFFQLLVFSYKRKKNKNACIEAKEAGE